MNTIILYTENYALGGGNRYLIDFLNCIPSFYKVILVSNKNGLFYQDFNKITRQYTYKEMSVWTIPKIKIFFGLKEPAIKKKDKIAKFLLGFFCKLLIPVLSHHNRRVFYNFLKANNPQMILSFNGGYPGGLSCLDIIYASKKLNISTVLSVVSMPCKIFFIEGLIYRRLKKILNAVTVNAQIIKDHFVSILKFDTNKIRVINNYVDVIGKKINCSNNFLETYKIEKQDKEIFIGYVGRIEKQKGVYVLLEAFCKVAQQNKNVKLLLIGDGDYFNNLKEIVEISGFKDRINMCGFYDGDIYDVMNSFDIFAFPSLWEGLPYVILESMNVENIIISTNVGGIPEIITDGVDGFLVEPNDSISMANCIKEVSNNLDKYRFLGVNAKNKIINSFSKDVFKRKVVELINSLL